MNKQQITIDWNFAFTIFVIMLVPLFILIFSENIYVKFIASILTFFFGMMFGYACSIVLKNGGRKIIEIQDDILEEGEDA